jgi:hypothetical protein
MFTLKEHMYLFGTRCLVLVQDGYCTVSMKLVGFPHFFQKKKCFLFKVFFFLSIWQSYFCTCRYPMPRKELFSQAEKNTKWGPNKTIHCVEHKEVRNMSRFPPAYSNMQECCDFRSSKFHLATETRIFICPM